MTRRSLVYLLFVFAGLTLSAGVRAQGEPPQDWLQWGGPSRNFKTSVTGLSASWPDAGLHRLWSRDLGEGYSSIIVETGTLYTMYRNGPRESVVALDAATGQTRWTFTYDAPIDGMIPRHGEGPHSTPLLVGDRLFAVGSTARLHCLNKKDGSVVWSHDLYKDFGAMFRVRGYSASPLAYRDLIVLTAGGKDNQSLMAFRQADGAVVWRGGNLKQSQASPILVNVDGQDQIVALLAADVAGFDPGTGAVLWSHPHPTSSDSGLNISTPVWGEDNVLFVSSSYDGGTRALRLSRKRTGTEVEQLWFHKQMRIAFSTLMAIGDHLYGSSGDLGVGILTAVNRHTGDVVWRDRSFGTASFVYADGKLLLLDDGGTLGLVTVSPDGLQVHARAKVFDSLSWT
ncbi:MAG: PQQ-binding-like beta-propeller repeat protein, partial [Vicinamibacterales bacterium]